MPIYEYQCAKCSHHLEALQKISDKPLRECPECGRRSLKRLMSAPLFRLAGSGWYETDFKSDKEQKRNLAQKGDAEPAAASETKAEAKTTDSSAVKAEAKPANESGGGTRRPAARKPAAKPQAKTASRKKAPARARKR
jgi:putative FmdB family regulatory protein